MKNQVSDYRKRVGLSQTQLAKRCGVSQQQISRIENQGCEPSLPLAFLLAHVLECPLTDLFEEERQR